MELNPDQIAEQLGVAMLTFGAAINRHLPIPIDIGGLVEQADAAPEGVIKLHELLRDQPLEEDVALVAHGFLDAWNALVVIGWELVSNDDPTVREAAKGSYFWLFGQVIASIEFLKDREDA